MVSAGSSSALSPPLLLSPVGLSLLFAVFVAMHFQSLTGLSLSIDDDTAILRTDPSIWLHEGRWGAYLVERFIMPLPAITFLPYAVFGACLCLAFALLAISLGITTLSWEILLGFALFVGVPQWLFLMEFSANIVPVGIGFLCAAASVVTLDRAAAQRRGIPERLAFVGASVGLLALATGLYQSLLLAGLLLASAVVVVRLARAEIDLQDAARMHASIAFVGVLAYAFYAAVSEIFSLLQPNIQRGEFYADSLFRPLEALRHIDRSWTAAVGAYRELVWGHQAFYGASVFASGLATIVASLTLVLLAFRSGPVRGLLVGLWVAAAWLAVVIFQLASSGQYFVPYRMMVQLPALVAVLAIVAISIGPKAARMAVALLFAVAAFQESVVINRAAASHELVAARDVYIVGDLFVRIANKGRPGADGIYKIQILGVAPGAPAYRSDFFGSRSWFGHDPYGQAFRVANYMRILGYPVTDAGRRPDEFRQQWAGMPQWPAEGSVVAVDDITLIKLSDVPWLQ